MQRHPHTYISKQLYFIHSVFVSVSVCVFVCVSVCECLSSAEVDWHDFDLDMDGMSPSRYCPHV